LYVHTKVVNNKHKDKKIVHKMCTTVEIDDSTKTEMELVE